VWNALFDAVIECKTQGFSSEELYDMLPEVFEKVYHSLKRKEARENVTQLYLINQAGNGTEKSIKEFSEHLSMWLAGQGKEKGDLGRYRGIMQGKKLKKGK